MSKLTRSGLSFKMDRRKRALFLLFACILSIFASSALGSERKCLALSECQEVQWIVSKGVQGINFDALQCGYSSHHGEPKGKIKDYNLTSI